MPGTVLRTIPGCHARAICVPCRGRLKFSFNKMALTVEEVRRIAALARLALTPDEEETFVAQLGKIVDYIDQLKEFPTAEAALPETAGFEAEDRVGSCLPRETFLANAPESRDGFLLVPEVKTSDDG